MAYAARCHYGQPLTGSSTSTGGSTTGSTPGHGRRARLDDATARSKGEGHCCALGFLKSVLYFFCSMLMLSGFILSALSAYTIAYRHSLADLLSSDGSSLYSTLTYLLVVSSGTLIVVSVLGCCGTAKENRCLLLMFSFCLFCIFLVEACSTVIAYVYETRVHDELARQLNSTIQHRYGNDSTHTDAIDQLQRNFKCCGARNHNDWEHRTRYITLHNVTTSLEPRPQSCCKVPAPGCADVLSSQTIYYRGCIDKLERYIREHLIIIGAAAAGVCSLQVFGIMFSCSLARSIHQWKQRQKYM